MPTGYTADIKDGTSFEQFVWSCARAFGALVMLRDDATAPIPDRFEPSAYYAESVQKSEAELARLHSLTKEQASADCLAAYRQELESYNKRCATCEPKDHDKCGKELIAAAEALEAALTSRVAGVVAPFTLSTPVDSPLHGNAGVKTPEGAKR